MSNLTPQAVITRQMAVSSKQQAPTPRRRDCPLSTVNCPLFLDIEHHLRSEGFHERKRFGVVILFVGGLDDQKEFFTRRQSEPWNVKDRMIRPRQAVQEQHPEHSRK